MDLGRIKQRGRSKSLLGWLTNPVRSVFWKLAIPYYEGIASEVDVDQKRNLATKLSDWQDDLLDRLEEAVLPQLETRIAPKLFESLQPELSRKLEVSIGDRVGALAVERLKALVAERLEVLVNARMTGARKDMVALAHRLSGLESEAGNSQAKLQALRVFSEGLDVKVLSEVQAARAFTQALQLEKNNEIASLRDAVNGLSAQLAESYVRYGLLAQRIEALAGHGRSGQAEEVQGPQSGGRQNRTLIQYASGPEHENLLALTFEVHSRYCRQHGIEYWIDNTPDTKGRSPHWRKVELLIEAMAQGYDQVAWVDTDCVIVDPSVDIFAASGFGIAVCESFDSPTIERHLNTGVLLAGRSDATIEFLKAWNEMPTGGRWEDQSAFIDLMATRPYRDLLTVLPNRFNCLAEHMEAREPIIRAFHGDPDRAQKIAALIRQIGITPGL